MYLYSLLAKLKLEFGKEEQKVESVSARFMHTFFFGETSQVVVHTYSRVRTMQMGFSLSLFALSFLPFGRWTLLCQGEREKIVAGLLYSVHFTVQSASK